MSEARMMNDPPPADWRPYAVDQLHRAERAEAGLAATKDALRHALLTCIDMRSRAEAAEAKVAKVEALADEWEQKARAANETAAARAGLHDEEDLRVFFTVMTRRVRELRAVLADAPAEQRAEDGA